MSRELGNVSCDLDLKAKVKGQIMYFLENTSPHNVLEVALQILPVHRSHDVKGTRQHFM